MGIGTNIMNKSLIWIFTGMSGVALFASSIYNMAWNNLTIETQAYRSVSRAKGLSGHIEYTRYADGSRDVRVYHPLGHKIFDSELHQDFNGDGKVDRIRVDGADLKFNSLTEILVREQDYKTHRKRFDEADRQLQELMGENDK